MLYWFREVMWVRACFSLQVTIGYTQCRMALAASEFTFEEKSKREQLGRYSDQAAGCTSKDSWFDSRHRQDFYPCSKTPTPDLGPFQRPVG